jgi:hypothetical protein
LYFSETLNSVTGMLEDEARWRGLFPKTQS